VNQISTECIGISGGLPGVTCTYMLEKLQVVAKESTNIQPGNAEIERRGMC
jgi:hypothetical protein